MAGVLSYFSLRTFFHGIVASQYYYALHYIFAIFHVPETDDYKMFTDYAGQLRFLTNWNAILQAIFFTICLLNDIFGTNETKPKKESRLRKIKDIFHISLGFPIAAYVTITFWGLYAIDRELVLPKRLDPYFPLWLNHIVHTNVAVFTIVELVSSFRVYPKSYKPLLITIAFNLIYMTWVFIIFFKTDHWVYPVLEVQNWPQRICFFASSLLFGIALYFLGRAINNRVWRKDLSLVETSKKKGK